ncbi:MAG: DUF3368 domain-containing protein [Candidatus Sumerlaeota bacterium]|nr:DUF3368 domain-containing protein [Candidatus Sumerlaeota bacterium]
MIIVADSSPLIALAACDCLHLLDSLFQQVRIPPSVFDEVTIANKPMADKLRQYLDGKVATLAFRDYVVEATGLGRGETDAMMLYKQLKADRLLVDDKRARMIALINSIEIVGSPGILAIAKIKGIIPAAKPLLEIMSQANIRISHRIIDHTLRICGEK